MNSDSPWAIECSWRGCAGWKNEFLLHCKGREGRKNSVRPAFLYIFMLKGWGTSFLIASISSEKLERIKGSILSLKKEDSWTSCHGEKKTEWMRIRVGFFSSIPHEYKWQFSLLCYFTDSVKTGWMQMWKDRYWIDSELRIFQVSVKGNQPVPTRNSTNLSYCSRQWIRALQNDLNISVVGVHSRKLESRICGIWLQITVVSNKAKGEFDHQICSKNKGQKVIEDKVYTQESWNLWYARKVQWLWWA